MRRRKTADGQFYGRRCISVRNVHATVESLASRSPFPICVHGRLLRGPWDGLHSVASPAILECGGKRSATPLWLARPGVPAHSKRRRCCALPAHSKSPGCRLSCGLLCICGSIPVFELKIQRAHFCSSPAVPIRGNAVRFDDIRRRKIPKNEAKSSGIWAALPHLAKMRNGATKKAEILFKKTLTQTGGSEKLTPH